MEIQEIRSVSLKTQELISGFVMQLTGQRSVIEYSFIEQIISNQNSHLFFAINDQGKYVGMITVGFYISPTGKKSWVEDVLVDEVFRGKGIGKLLVEFAINFAKEQKATSLMLTSNPTRISANKLYKKLGFQQKETNVYMMLI